MDVVNAILWDGNKQLQGKLIFEKKRIKFNLNDFSDTDLDFDLAYKEIKQVNYYKLYELTPNGIEIISTQGRNNVFILDNPQEIKKMIDVRNELF